MTKSIESIDEITLIPNVDIKKIPDIQDIKRPGRKIDPSLPRGGQVWFRCTPTERQMFEADARSKGLTVSSWVRMMLLRALDEERFRR